MSSKAYGYFIQRKRPHKGSHWVDWDGFIHYRDTARVLLLRRRKQDTRGSSWRIVRRPYNGSIAKQHHQVQL